MRTFAHISHLKAFLGEEVGVSEWVLIDQNRVNLFADATGDHQWIHTDPERAAKGPFRTAIAHGYLTLSLLVPLADSACKVQGVTMTVNYGLNKVRFPAPVPVASRIRARVALIAVDEINGGVQVTWGLTMQREGATKPVCVAESVTRLYD